MINSPSQLSREQLDHIEKFLVTFNEIDKTLRERLKAKEHCPFARLVRDYKSQHRYWRDDNELLLLKNLRNVVVHDRQVAYQYLSVPTFAVLESIEAIRDRLLRPATTHPTFKRPSISSVQTSDSLHEVLKLIHDNGFSQFPVYEGDAFVGLLTENGITRWLSARVTQGISLVDFQEEAVDSLLEQEEQRHNYTFVSKDTPVDQVAFYFRESTLLEAAFVTHSGQPHEALLGIATRWDFNAVA